MLKYQQIVVDILYEIEQGFLAEGAKLPSIRELKNQYFCSSETVIKALNELKYQHRIFSIPKSGFYVLSKSNYQSTENTNMIDFATATPEKTMFPYTEFQHCLNQAIEIQQGGLFSYGMTVNGLESLIVEMKKLLEQYQVFANKENIVITTGTQQALYILTAIPFPNEGDTILVEQPTYHLFNRLLETTNIKCLGIKRDANGIDLQQLENIFAEHRIKFFYTMPRFHNPLGTSFSKKEKLNILALAKKYNVYIVEDDYVADFDLNTKADPMFAYDVCHRVIYLKSFSKIIFPGLRVGITVLPNIILDKFLALKRVIDYDTSLITQGALELYLKSGMFHSHSRLIAQKYAEKSSILHQEVQKLASSSIIGYTQPSSLDTKLHIVLPEKLHVNTLIQRLLVEDVHLNAIDDNYLINFYKENILKIDARNTNQSLVPLGVQKIFIAIAGLL
ncbi:PLP-dependent aminotransferase family protein [Lysinibacillus xylanilyticus]|uniref:aminotransferase-like domain-containing protein n=1 Tax=Lysinibacillus xylanilyticus TaxID=582475 RepID=UPI003D072B86